MTTAALEVETKYDVALDSRLPDLGCLAGVARVGEPATVVLEAIYYDTPRLDLHRAGITLRRRTGGTDAGWHLKLPVGADRYELQRPLGPPTQGPPPELVDVVRGTVRDQRLVPIARIDTLRTTVRLYGDADRLLAEVCDDRVTADHLTGAPAPTSTWREWEIELHDALPGLASGLESAIAAVLLEGGARRSSRRAKLDRVIGTDEPRFSLTAAPTGRLSAAEALAPYLVAKATALLALDPLVRADVPDGVHRMRVTARQVKSVLQVYGDLFDRGTARRLRSNLGWLVDVLGQARDLEVLAARLDALPGGPGARTVTAEHREAHRAAVAAMTSSRYFALTDTLAAFAAHPPWRDRAQRPARKVLRSAIRAEEQHLQHAAAAADRSLPPAVRARHLHDVRKAAKRLRYAVEAVEPVFGEEVAAYRGALTQLQNVLGAHHDTVVARARLVTLVEAPDLSGRSGRTAALADLDRAARADEEAYRAAIAGLQSPRLRRWLD